MRLTKRSLELAPKPSHLADRVMQFHSRAGVKQTDLPPDFDIIKLEHVCSIVILIRDSFQMPRMKHLLSTESPPSIGVRVVLVIPAYQEFIGNLPTSILQHIDVDLVQQISNFR